MLIISVGVYITEFYPYGTTIWQHRIDSCGIDTKFKVNSDTSCCIGVRLTSSWHRFEL